MTTAAANSIGVVNTGGGVILANHYSITVPTKLELNCGGSNWTDVHSDDYRGMPNAIILDPTDAHTTRLTIDLSNNNSSFMGCNLLAGVGTSSTSPNTYSPTVWFPNCHPTSSPCANDGAPYLRSAMLEASGFAPGGPAYGATGISITADHVAVQNVAVLGFGTCYSVYGGVRPVIDHLTGDCNTGMSIINSNNPHIDSFNIHPNLTGGAYADFIGDIEGITASGGGYNVTAEVDAFYNSDGVALKTGDTVWIATGAGGGRESARGRWTIGAPSTVTCTRASGHHCQQFSLTNAVSSPIATDSSSHPTINTSIVNGTPPTAMLNVVTAPAANLKLISPGQVIIDTTQGGCIANGTTVAAVWPARGIVYMSAPALCSNSSDNFTFTDNSYNPGNHCTVADMGDLDQQSGCLYVDAAFRYGDGVTIGNTGGASVTNCNVFGHMVSFHMITGANQGRWVNCATGDNLSLPDRNLAAVNTDGNLVSLWISGTTSPASDTDACDMDWSNSVLGQHRPVAILVQSDCAQVDKFTNISLGVDNGQRNGIALELDGGGVALANAAGSGAAKIFIADQPSYATEPSTFSISSDYLPDITLYAEDATATASTTGCGNVFAVPTPYLCVPPSSAVPEGRLTLTTCASGRCYPVMIADKTMATTVYYVPYTGQRVPIYNSETGAFGPADTGSSGLSMNLDTSNHLANKLYDVFADIHAGAIELCTGPAWTDTVTRSTDVVQAGGLWVNAAQVSCVHASSQVRTCVPFECTYLGTFYTSAAGQTEQQFGPNSGSGGSGNCLCLYNAYNRVMLTSESLDSESAYDYNSSTWRAMGTISPNKNNITVVDGLGQMQVSAQLHDAVNKKTGSGSPGAIGINFNTTSGAPAQYAQTATTTLGTFGAVLTRPPAKGLWFVQAMEVATAGSGSVYATFGGISFQEISVQVED